MLEGLLLLEVEAEEGKGLVDKWRMVVEWFWTAINWDGEGGNSCWMSWRRREEEGRWW